MQSAIGGGAYDEVYEYTGQTTLKNIDFSAQNYKDTKSWRKILALPGQKYVYYFPLPMTVDLSTEDYLSPSRGWKLWQIEGAVKGASEFVGEILDTKLKDVLGGGQSASVGAGGLVVRNDVRAVAQAYIRFAQLTAGSVSVAVSPLARASCAR